MGEESSLTTLKPEESREMSTSDSRVDLQTVSPEAFEEMIRAYETPLLRYVGRLLGVGTAEIEDVVQESFIRLHRHLSEKGEQSIEQVRPWLYRVAHNLAMDIGRRKTLGKKIHQDIQVELENTVDEKDPHEQSVQKEEGQLALAELDKLPELDRQILLLKTVQGLKLREISEILDLKIPTVSYRLNQALKKLAERLQQAGVHS